MAVDHPLLAVAHGARLQLRRIGAGRVRLGHAEGAAQVAGEQRMQPAILLLGRAGHREDLRVARVGRGVAERQRRDRRGAEDLVHQPEAHLAHALAAELGRQVGGPQPALLDLLLQRRDRLAQTVQAELVPDRLERPDLARARARPSSRAAPGSRGRWRSPSSWPASFRSATDGSWPQSLRLRAACAAGLETPPMGRLKYGLCRARELTVGRRDQSQATTPPGTYARAREGAASSADSR